MLKRSNHKDHVAVAGALDTLEKDNKRSRVLSQLKLLVFHCRRGSLAKNEKYFLPFFFLRVTPTVYESSQDRGHFGATAAGLHHSHRNARSKPHLQPIPQLMAMPDP